MRLAVNTETLKARAAALRLEQAGGKFNRYFPDCITTAGDRCERPNSALKMHHRNADGSQRFCRCLYPKHVAFMDAGAEYRERGIIAGNRVGKSELGAFETTCHLTGRYPAWWKGRRFDTPVSWWVAGDTGKTTRNIIQDKLMGPPTAIGTGFIPSNLLVHKTKKGGIADAYETCWVRHVSGGSSTCEFKSYDQRREGFQGTAQHGIWLDEEPEEDIYTECLLRTAKTSDFPGGIILLTFTPLKGRTKLVRQYLKDADKPDIDDPVDDDEG